MPETHLENVPPHPQSQVLSFGVPPPPPPWGPGGHSLGKLDPDLCVLRKTRAVTLPVVITKQEPSALSPHLAQESAERTSILQMGKGRLRALSEYFSEVTQ